ARRYCPRPMHLPAIDLRPGALIDFEGRMATVVWWNILRNDRRQFVQMRIRDLETVRLKELKENGDTRFEVLEKEEVDLAYSYRDGIAEAFSTDDGQRVRCPMVAAEDALKWPAEAYRGFYVSGALVAVYPPRHSVLTVTETDPPMRGAGTGQKDAVLENGV